MTKTLVKYGDDAALIIDKSILEILNIGIDTPLQIQIDEGRLIISPILQNTSELKAALQKVNKAHKETLEKLAK